MSSDSWFSTEAMIAFLFVVNFWPEIARQKTNSMEVNSVFFMSDFKLVGPFLSILKIIKLGLIWFPNLSFVGPKLVFPVGYVFLLSVCFHVLFWEPFYKHTKHHWQIFSFLIWRLLGLDNPYQV